MDFENILKYFRVSLPRKFLTQDHCNAFFRRMSAFKVVPKPIATPANMEGVGLVVLGSLSSKIYFNLLRLMIRN